MTQSELYALMERFDKSGISELIYKQGEESILLKKAAEPSIASTAAPSSVSVAAPVAAPPAATPVGADNSRVIKAPLVGTYYASSAPDAPPFAVVGKAFKKGETVAVIEAMKMINEVPAPCNCVVEEILVGNGALVGYGEPLLRIAEKFD